MTVEDFRWIAEQSKLRCNQFALGGRGDPDQHEHFEEILKICHDNHLVPNFTTSGYGMTPEIAELCKKYCGAVAVSWYRSEYTLKAIQMLMDAGVKTNIHYVLGKNSIDEAIERLKNDDFPKGVNAVIFLLHKPAGQGTKANMLSAEDVRVGAFFAEVDKRHSFKVGMDSCNVPGAINFCKSILPESLDTCEGGRYSCYISADMIMVPCSFDQEKRYEVSLREMNITEAWNSEPFEQFRNKMRGACPNCKKKELCMGGCPLMSEIVLCTSSKRNIQ
jgi:radical SAM protein with 4Fe4S-binding SPASM domain